MGSFGYNEEGNRFTGNPSDDTKVKKLGTFTWTDGKKKPKYKYKYGTGSPYISLVFLDYFYMSWMPYCGTTIKFDRWKPTWATT